jgi:Colicin V production protein
MHMIAAATHAGFGLDNLPFNWFDLALPVILGIGIFRGRKNGMTKEFLPTLQWLVIVIGCGLGYALVGQIFINTLGWKPTASYVTGYLCIAFVVWLIFRGLKQAFEPRLAGSNIFGSNEYYLAMVSGFIRFACVLIVVLAFLNAPYYSQADIIKKQAYNNRWFGGGLNGFKGDFIPDLQNVQENVFKNSFTGPYIKQGLAILLIESDSPASGKQTSGVPEQKKPVIHIGN